MLYSNLDVSEMFVDRQAQRSSMHARHLNEQLVRVLKTIGYDVGFQKGQGQYLFDRDDVRYLDLLSGFGVFAIGRNHPALRAALKSVLDSDLPNLVQLDVSTLACVLAERLLEYVPYLDKVFFANSGAETVEAAIKFARGATGRPGIVYCSHAYHGLHRAVSRGRALERRARHGAAVQGIVRRPRPGRCAAHPQEYLRQDLQPDGPCGGARLDLREKRPRNGGRHRDARGDQVGKAG